MIHDEIRPDIVGTIALTAAGVEVRVISGDHPETVRTARASPTAPLITEAEFAPLTGAAFEQAARTTVPFARTTPPTKRGIIASLGRGLVLPLPLAGRLLLRLHGPFVRGMEGALGVR